MERTLIGELGSHIGETISISGWVDVRRDQGKMIFLEIRDMSGNVTSASEGRIFGSAIYVRDTRGTVQAVILPGSPYIETGKKIRSEFVVEVEGIVKERPEKNKVPDVLNGNIELHIEKINILNEADAMPFDISGDTIGIDENVRAEYRYLDLRSKRMQKNMHVRSEFVRHCREYLFSKEFIEIETPLLTESTPEGSRDFVVPSRLNPGKFYALPQSPQQYKQLLMTAGFERYFQIARAVRDEDLRADRGFEHTQVDIEMSFVTMEDVMAAVEDMITTVVEAMGYTIKQKPFPRI